MLTNWPIRNKLQLGLGLLLVIVLTLFGSACYGLYAYRSLVKSLHARSKELPLASELSQGVANLRVTLSQARERQDFSRELADAGLPANASSEAKSSDPFDLTTSDPFDLSTQFRYQYENVTRSLGKYEEQLDKVQQWANRRIGDNQYERQTLQEIHQVLRRIENINRNDATGRHELGESLLAKPILSTIIDEVEKLNELTATLPSHLYKRLDNLADDVRSRYRAAIVVAWTTAMAGLVMLGLALHVFSNSIAKPLELLVSGSRDVAAGNFAHRIHMETNDELGELADAMNAMTSRFQETRDDLDRQVRERTKQVVRSEQLASVGFLAAGVAHEINNPLASIALCSESLEGRLTDFRDEAQIQDAELEVVNSYLAMIQQEAFRCKQITEKLLDFSRMGDMERHPTDIRELVDGVIEMVRHLGKYRDKRLELDDGDHVVAEVNAQEIKQVVLNLVANGLDSLAEGGVVRVAVVRRGNEVAITVTDNGCGMSEEVIKHLFEPFFTRRRGGQGTGLGLSITYRIVEEHNGRIEASSEGLDRGSRFVVTLPLSQDDKENSHRYQAA